MEKSALSCASNASELGENGADDLLGRVDGVINHRTDAQSQTARHESQMRRARPMDRRGTPNCELMHRISP